MQHKAWYFVLMLTVLTIVGCNRYANQQTKNNTKTNVDQNNTKAESNFNTNDPTKAETENEDTPWRFDDKNEWIKEREGYGTAHAFVFPNPEKRSSIDSIFTHYKHHLGFGPDDTFKLTHTNPWANGGGTDYTYEHYFKGILVKPDYYKVSCDKEDKVSMIKANWLTDLDAVYEVPKEIQSEIIEKVVQNLNAKDYSVSEINLSINHTYVNYEKGELTLIYDFLFLGKMPKELSTYEVTASAITGEIYYILDARRGNNVTTTP